MEIRFVCLLLVLLGTIVLSQDANIRPRYEKFINQHINGQMRENRCDDVIRSRRITQTNSNDCKETNTFIRAGTGLVRGICGDAGAPYGLMRRSLKPFNVVVCKLKNQSRYPHCQYRGQDRTRYIVIACDQGFPVHFEEDIILNN
ncbi:ribonuclease-like 3 [Anabas testudineus]|uniref:Ribonuclease A-domain domain-containing protein n=1 Tax=Anabas testudineus TaxID=64144 RepID=A0A3Q1HHD9_ANATE|nr:ribonuclease-like 3 [Anabas testudineus]